MSLDGGYIELRRAVRRLNARLDCPEYLRGAHLIYDAGLVALAERYADTRSCPAYLREVARIAAEDAFG